MDGKTLHGYAMSKFPETSGFKWIDPKESDLNIYTSNSSKEKNLFFNLILNILKSYKNYSMSILQLQIK